MRFIEMLKIPNSSHHTRDFLPSPALSLTLAGNYRDGGAAAASREPERGSGGGGQREETLELSSENSGAGKYRSDEDCELAEGIDQYGDDDDESNGDKKKKKRKKYHRHTPEQIREMEALFKESPHPDENQRLQMSKQLGLHPKQVKFWFQNRRTQIKAIQERHENSLLKAEIDKLRDENKVLRGTLSTPSSCPNCGFTTISAKESFTSATEEQKLRIENATLKAEVVKLRSITGKQPHGTSSNTSSCPSGNNDQENRSSFDYYTCNFGLEKSRITEAVDSAVEELIKMATQREPLWVRSYETGREMLNYDEYTKGKELCDENYQPKKSVEASRDSRIIFVDLLWLVQSFMNANQWQELFPSLISKAATLDVICNGEAANRDGSIHLMFAEIQMLTPMVATREIYFFRHCKKLSTNQWAIVDVSIDNNIDDNIDASLQKCRKRPSGCIVEDKSNGHCKVTWVEHIECQKIPINSLYRTTVNSALAFGAKHWICTLQQQCERLVFLVATNVPVKDSSGVATLAGRKSILNLSQRMSWSFCRALGGSSCHSWQKIVSKTGDDIRVSKRKNLNQPGEPLGAILSAVSSVWLPLSHHVLFDFLRDENRRKEWDIMSNGGTVQSIANLAKGQDRGNAVTILAMKTNEQSVWVLQDSCTNAYESMVVYAPVDISGMQSVMKGCDSSKIVVLPSGFTILPDGIESRPLVITSRLEEKSTDGGSLLTIAFQIVISNSPTAKLSMDSVDTINTLISRTLQNIKRGLQCEDC